MQTLLRNIQLNFADGEIKLTVGNLSLQKNYIHLLEEERFKKRGYILGDDKFSLINILNDKDDPKNDKFLKAWKVGMTGYPIVDAGMRELYETGWMHNRVRMIVASFLVKHLRIHWMEGEKHFKNCLVDYNEASNVAQWQWVAGCGADAAPYFRIFNPILQGEKFDKDGIYTKKWVPELKNMPNKFLYKPWELETKYQEQIKVIVGINYPKPIVDHVEARNAASQRAGFSGQTSL